MGGVIQTAPFETGVNNTVLFARNPVNPNEYALVNVVGQLYTGGLGGAGGVAGDPFTQFTYQVLSRDENDAAVGDIRYSPDGRLAFVIDAGKVDKDGVWILQGGTPQQVLRDCPRDGHPGCLTVAGDRNIGLWRSRAVTWSPFTPSNSILIELDILSGEGRSGFVVVSPGANPAQLPPVYVYDTAGWAQDGSVLASGIRRDGQPVIDRVNPFTGEVQTLFNGGAQTIYPRDAVQRPNGAIVAFGSHLFDGGPVRLIDTNGNNLSGNVGSAPPSRIEWSPDYNSALVRTQDGRSYVVNANNGAITDITPQVGGVASSRLCERRTPGTGQCPARTIC